MRGRTRPVMGWCILFALGMASGCLAIPGLAQWSPKKNVEIVAMSGPGGANDIIARTVQDIIQQKKLVEAPVTVVSKVGAGGVLAWSQAQIAYWEDVLAKLVQTEEWKKDSPIELGPRRFPKLPDRHPGSERSRGIF